jgi:ribosome-associated toxin RatA of RatAB toxin-antitoxin module
MSTHIQRSALLPYPARALYDLVNDVARYPEFLPWCASSEIIEASETHMRASLEVAKGGVSQRFTTHNLLVPGQSINLSLEKGPFKQLHGQWLFKTLGENACKISLELSFDYAGALVRVTLGPLFNQASNTMVDAFCERARQLYG